MLRRTGTLQSVTAVANFPHSLDGGWLERLRRPLAALAATILVVDLMGLGMHLADSAESPFANDTPTRAKTTIGGPAAVAANASANSSAAERRAARNAEPLGCLALNSGCYPGPPAPTAPSNAAKPAPPAGGGTTTPPTTAPNPLLQADVGVPALGAQVSVGLGDGGCTGLDLTVLAVGGCPTASGDDPVILNLRGALLGN